MDKVIYILKLLRNIVFMWSASLGFLMLMTFVAYRFKVSSSIVYFMIVLAYILGGIVGGLFSKGPWMALFSGTGFILSIKLVESICGKGDVYHQNIAVYVLIIAASFFGYFI